VVSHISRKTSEIWGTRDFVRRIEPDVQCWLRGDRIKAFEGLAPAFSAQVSGFPARGPTNARVSGFIEESRMKFANARKLDRKSGVCWGEGSVEGSWPRCVLKGSSARHFSVPRLD
jgi:hypothetical protein